MGACSGDRHTLTFTEIEREIETARKGDERLKTGRDKNRKRELGRERQRDRGERERPSASQTETLRKGDRQMGQEDK